MKRNARTQILQAGLLVASGLGLWGCPSMNGCGAPMSPPEEIEPAETAEQIALATKNLLGAYTQPGDQGLYRGLVLVNKDNTRTYFASVNLGCPNPAREEGTFSATSTTLTLNSQASRRVYRYTLNQNELTLKDRSGQAVAVLGRVQTFCTRSTDCEAQSYPHILCVGAPLCAPGQTCGWNCGPRKAGYGDACTLSAGCPDAMKCSVEDARGCPPPKPPTGAQGVCRAEPVDPCRGYLCVTGERCEVQDGEAVCAPLSQNICPRVRCAGNVPHCVEWAATNESACLAEDQCHRDADCQGKRCVPEHVCVRAPCFARLVCR